MSNDDDKKPTNWMEHAQMFLITIVVVVGALLLLRYLGLR